MTFTEIDALRIAKEAVMYRQQVLDAKDRISELSLELEQKDRRIKDMAGVLISMAMESTE